MDEGKKSSGRVYIERVLKRLLSFALLTAILGFLVYRAFPSIMKLLTSGMVIHLEYMVLAAVTWIFSVLLAVLVWHDILRRLGVSNPQYFFDLQVYAASAVARKIPGTLWYAVGRLAAYQARGVGRRPVILGLAVEMALFSLSAVGTLMASIAIGMPVPDWLNRELLWVVVLPLTLTCVILVGPRLIQWAVRYRRSHSAGEAAGLDSSQGLVISSLDMLRWFILEASVIALNAVMVHLILLAFDPMARVSFAGLLGAYSLATALGPVAMWLPGDIGLRDGFIYLALQGQTGQDLAALTTLGFRLLVSALEIGFGLLSIALLSQQLDPQKINILSFKNRR